MCNGSGRIEDWGGGSVWAWELCITKASKLRYLLFGINDERFVLGQRLWCNGARMIFYYGLSGRLRGRRPQIGISRVEGFGFFSFLQILQSQAKSGTNLLILACVGEVTMGGTESKALDAWKDDKKNTKRKKTIRC